MQAMQWVQFLPHTGQRIKKRFIYQKAVAHNDIDPDPCIGQSFSDLKEILPCQRFAPGPSVT